MIVVRLIGFAFVVILAFSAALAGLLFSTGKLNWETYEILTGKRPAVEAPVKKPDDVDIVSRALREREQALDAREKQETLDDLKVLNDQINQAEDAARFVADAGHVDGRAIGVVGVGNGAGFAIEPSVSQHKL